MNSAPQDYTDKIMFRGDIKLEFFIKPMLAILSTEIRNNTALVPNTIVLKQLCTLLSIIKTCIIYSFIYVLKAHVVYIRSEPVITCMGTSSTDNLHHIRLETLLGLKTMVHQARCNRT